MRRTACDAVHASVTVLRPPRSPMGSEPSEDPRDLQPPLAPPTTTSATSITSESAELHFVLDRLVRRHIEAVIPAPTIAAFGIDGKHYELLRLGVDRPEDAVLGLQLPSRFGALGVIATSVIATPPKRTLQDAALALGVTRTSQTVSLLATSDGPSTTTLNPQGWLIDACRRAVGLPTPPCSIAPVAFPIALWLDRLMVSVLNEQHPPTTWSDAVALCHARFGDTVVVTVATGNDLWRTVPRWSAT